jgi:hypothetical protein
MSNNLAHENLIESSSYSLEVQFREHQGLPNDNYIQHQEDYDES